MATTNPPRLLDGLSITAVDRSRVVDGRDREVLIRGAFTREETARLLKHIQEMGFDLELGGQGR